MFTGLVQCVGRLENLSFRGDSGRLTLSARMNGPFRMGESMAVNGACLTLVEQHGTQLVFDVLKETLDKTSLRDKSPGAPVNLERALRVGDLLGGHWVSGHVDGTGQLLQIESSGRDRILRIGAPEFIGEILPKGSITVDGISLTVVDVAPAAGTFSVHVIPHTWNETALASLAPGQRVNLETDMIGKYVRAALARPASPPPLTWDRLRAAGWVE